MKKERNIKKERVGRIKEKREGIKKGVGPIMTAAEIKMLFWCILVFLIQLSRD